MYCLRTGLFTQQGAQTSLLGTEVVWGEAFAQGPLTMLEVRIVQYVTCTSYLVRERGLRLCFLNISFVRKF